MLNFQERVSWAKDIESVLEHPDLFYLSAALRQETICALGEDTQPLRAIRSDLQVDIFVLL